MKHQTDKTGRGQRCGKAAGISYVEVLAAGVLMSILLVTSMRLFGNLGRSRLHTLDRDAGCQLAIDMIEEIRQKAYRDPVDDGEFGPGADEADSTRSLFDDVDDYHGWTAKPPQSAAGAPMSQYARFTRSVMVQYVSSADFNAVVETDEGFLQVTVGIDDDSRRIQQQTCVIANTDAL